MMNQDAPTPLLKVTKEFEKISLSTPKIPLAILKDFVTPEQDSFNEEEKSSQKNLSLISTLSPIKSPLDMESNEFEAIDLEFSNDLFGAKEASDFGVFTDLKDIPAIRIASYLTDENLVPAIAVSKNWNLKFDDEAIFKYIYKRRSRVVFGQRSYSRSWKSLLKNKIKLEEIVQLGSQNSTSYIDMSSYISLKEGTDTLEFEMSTSGARVEACFELFPRFYWILFQSINGKFVCGILLNEKNQIVRESGLDVFRSYIRSIDCSHYVHLNPRLISLIMLSVHAFPSHFDLEKLVSHSASSLSFEPFELVLGVSAASTESETITFTTTKNAGRSNFPALPVIDENFNIRHGADLILHEVDQKLKWELKSPKRRLQKLSSSRAVLRRLG